CPPDLARVYGTMIVSPSPHWPAAVKSAGADFVFIDTEHIAIDRTTLAWMCQTYRALGLAPLARIPSPDPYQATVALDNGASGVLAPYVETPEQARRVRGAGQLRPLKRGGLGEGLNGERELGTAGRPNGAAVAWRGQAAAAQRAGVGRGVERRARAGHGGQPIRRGALR